MLKYYIFAFIKANMLVFLIFSLLWLGEMWNSCPEYHFWIWVISNIYFQLTKPSYLQADRIEDHWNWLRITKGLKWYDRYFNCEIRKELKNIK